MLANIRGDYGGAFRLGEGARRLSELRGDSDNLQNAYAVLTSTAFDQGQYAEAQQYARQAYHLATAADNHWFLAYYSTAFTSKDGPVQDGSVVSLQESQEDLDAQDVRLLVELTIHYR